MLSLNFKSGESVMVGDDIRIRVEDMGAYIRLAIDAPNDVHIVRQTLLGRSLSDAQGAATKGGILKLAAARGKTRRKGAPVD